jgi:CcmD family protein
MIEGAWGYVIAAYVVTWLFLGGYAISLWARRPRGDGRSE